MILISMLRCHRKMPYPPPIRECSLERLWEVEKTSIFVPFCRWVKLLMHCGLKIYSSTLCSFLNSSPPTQKVSKSVGVGEGSSTGICPEYGDYPSFCPSCLNDSVTACQKVSKSFLFVSSGFYKHQVYEDSFDEGTMPRNKYLRSEKTVFTNTCKSWTFCGHNP